MGYYINKDSQGNHLPMRGKAKALIADGGTEVSDDIFLKDMICVVENGAFDAAGYVYSEQEFNLFKEPDLGAQRKRIWLTHPRATVLSGYDR